MGSHSLLLCTVLLRATLCSCFTRLEPLHLGDPFSSHLENQFTSRLEHQFPSSGSADFLPHEPATLDIEQAVDRGEALQNIFEVENLGDYMAREIETVDFGGGQRDQSVQLPRGFLRMLGQTSSTLKKTSHGAKTGGGLQPVVFRPCPGGGPAPTSLHVNCTARERDVCSLARGASHALVVTFTPTTTSSHAVVSLLSWRTWLELPLVGQDTRACSYMTCPLKKGKKTTLDYRLNIPDTVGQKRDTIIWRLFDKETRDRLLCFTFRTHIT